MARKLDEEKRVRILHAARDAFGSEGFQRTTIKGIAEATGVAQGTIYTYFESKEKLFDEVVEEIWETFDREINRINVESSSIVDKVTGFLNYSFEILVQVHPLLRGMYTEAVKRDLLREKLDVICNYIEDLFTSNEGAPLIYQDRSAETRRFNINVMVAGIL